MAGDEETGVMSMRMAEGLDTGPVLMAERTRIGRKTYGELHDELARLGADLMVRTLAALERATISEQAQPQAGVTYAKKILKEETRIDWTRPAREIDCLIRGLSPTPGAWTELKGERVKVLNCEPVEGRGTPGTLLDDALTIACGSGALRLTRLQRPGKSAMDAGELLRGFALPRGTKFA
jgi:methionyl-tRNA formyltransferase